MREKLDDQAKLTFSLHLSLSNLSINIHGSPVTPLNYPYDKTTLLINKLTTQLDINSIFQKFDFKLRKLLLFNENSKHAMNLADNSLEKLIINTGGGDLLNQGSARQSAGSRKLSNITPQNNNFIEVTMTRALVANLNKRLNYSSSPYKYDSQNHVKNRYKSKSKLDQLNIFRTSQKWIVEVNCTLNELDLLIHSKKLELIWEFSCMTQLLMSKYKNESTSGKKSQSSNDESMISLPLVRSSDMPLVNFEMNKIRVIVPCSTTNGSGDFNCVVAQIMSLNLTSQIENPLIRNFLHSSISSNIYNK